MTQKNQLPKDSTKQIILGDLSSSRSTRKFDQEVQISKISSKNCIWSTKTKIFVAIGVLLIIAVGLGVGLYFRFRDRLQPISPINKVSLGNGDYIAFGEFELQERNLFSKDVSHKMILTQGIYNKANHQSRLLQDEGENEEIVEYSATVNMEEVGFQITSNSENQLGVQVDSEKLFEYLMSTEPEAARLLSEIMEIEDVDQAASVQQLEQQMSKLFNEELGTLGQFEFHETPIIELKLNQASSNYQMVGQNQVAIKDARRLLLVRILFFRRLFQSIKRVVQTIVRPVVQFVRNHGPTIGKVAGGIIGFVAGGPAGAKLGMKIGQGIGIAAQTFVKACVPQNLLAIRCTSNSMLSASFNLAKILGKKIITSKVSSTINSYRK